MLVIAIDGCEGSGKTSVCETFRTLGYLTLDDDMVDMSGLPNLSPTSVLMQLNWVCAWFQRVIAEIVKLRANPQKPAVLIVDRSPFSAYFYAKSCNEAILSLILPQLEELRVLGIHVCSVQLQCHPDTAFDRLTPDKYPNSLLRVRATSQAYDAFPHFIIRIHNNLHENQNTVFCRLILREVQVMYPHSWT